MSVFRTLMTRKLSQSELSSNGSDSPGNSGNERGSLIGSQGKRGSKQGLRTKDPLQLTKSGQSNC